MSNPYLVEGPASINFSGGRTSGFMLWHILDAHGGKLPPDVVVNFQNTGDESEPTLEFIAECEKRWNVRINWLEYDDVFDIEKYRNRHGMLTQARQRRNYTDLAACGIKVVTFTNAARKGEPYDKMLKYFADYRTQIKQKPAVLPNVTQRMCTASLKIKLNTYYMLHLGYENFDAITGIRFDEPKRWSKMLDNNGKNSQRFTYILPMMTARIAKPDVHEFWAKQPFDLQLDANSDEGNCRFCFLKAKHKLITIMQKDISGNGGRPTEEMIRWVQREKLSGQTFRRDRKDYAGLLEEALFGGVPVPKDEKVIDCICGE